MSDASPQKNDRPVRRVLAGLVILLALISVYSVRTADPDLWGHLRYGRFFLEAGLPPVADPFSYTTTGGVAWLAHEYLSQVILWVVYSAAGAAGLIALKCMVGLVVLALVYLAIRLGSDSAQIWAPVFILAALLLGRFFLFRPQIFTYLGLSLFVYLLLRRLFDRPSPLWLLPLVMIPWANFHGGFVAGIGVVGIVLGLRLLQSTRRYGPCTADVWRAVRPLVALLAGCVGASLLTPFGWRVWPFLWIELGNNYNRRLNEEWQPIRLASPGLDGALTLLLVALLVISCMAGMRRARDIAGLRPWHWLLSCVPLAAMAFVSRRHIPILVLWGAPVLCILVQTAWDAWPSASMKRGAVLSLTGLILLPAFISGYVTLVDPLPRIRINAESLGVEQPFGAAAFLRANGLTGNLYLPMWWGSYLTWELYPGIRVSMDGRNDTAYPVALVGENLEFYAGLGDTEAPLRRPTDFWLIPTSAPALPAIRADSRWIAIYEDADTVLFLRNDPAHSDSIRRYRAGEFVVSEVQRPQFFW